MKKSEKPSKTSEPAVETDHVGKQVAKKPVAQGSPPTANDLGQGIDRPGFDLGGSSGDTHAGTWLPLGNDAFDTQDERRLPGRRLDNDLTIPRWSGPDLRDTSASDDKAAGIETASTRETKKAR